MVKHEWQPQTKVIQCIWNWKLILGTKCLNNLFILLKNLKSDKTFGSFFNYNRLFKKLNYVQYCKNIAKWFSFNITPILFTGHQSFCMGQGHTLNLWIFGPLAVSLASFSIIRQFSRVKMTLISLELSSEFWAHRMNTFGQESKVIDIYICGWNKT